jgi:hypothetical protein
VPVAFVLTRGLAEKSTIRWNSWKLYRFRTGTPPKSQKSHVGSSKNASEAQQDLPQVPKGTLRTLLSFVRGPQSAHHGKKSQGTIIVTQGTDVEMRPYSELRSADMDNMYHSHLYNQGSQRNLIGHHTDVRAA